MTYRSHRWTTKYNDDKNKYCKQVLVFPLILILALNILINVSKILNTGLEALNDHDLLLDLHGTRADTLMVAEVEIAASIRDMALNNGTLMV